MQRPSRHGATGCRLIQAGATLGSAGVSQQAFEHEMGVRVGRIMPARVAPSSEIPIDGAGACDQVHEGYRLVGRPVRPRRSLCHCISRTNSVVLHFLWTRARTTNGQPGRSVVGPGWHQLGVSNCSFVTVTAVQVHAPSFNLRRTVAVPASMAATNKYLAQTNKFGERGRATKKRDRQFLWCTPVTVSCDRTCAADCCRRAASPSPWQRRTNVWRR